MNQNTIAKLCSRWDSCSVNNCPLDPGYPILPTLPDDSQKSCTVEKGVRLRAASKFPGVLKYGGLTTREYAARQHYDALSPEKKAAMVERAKTTLKSVRKDKTTKIGQQSASGERTTTG